MSCPSFECHICKLLTLKQTSLQQAKIVQPDNPTSKGKEDLLKTGSCFSPKDTPTTSYFNFEEQFVSLSYRERMKHILEEFC